MRPIYKSIIFSKITWLGLNALWILAPLVFFSYYENSPHLPLSSDSLFLVIPIALSLIVFCLLGVFFVIGEILNFLTTGFRLGSLLVNAAHTERKLSDLDIHNACRSWNQLEMSLDDTFFDDDNIIEIAHWPEVRIYPDPVGRNWFRKWGIDEISWGTILLWMFLLIGHGLFLHALGILPGTGISDLLIGAISAGAFSIWASIKWRKHDIWHHFIYRQALYEDWLFGVSQIRFNSEKYWQHYMWTWDSLERSKYLETSTIDHSLIEGRMQWPYDITAAPRGGSFWAIGQTLYWNARKIQICRWDRLPYPVVFRDTAHQLPPSGVYQFEFEAPRQKIDAAHLAATNQIQILTGEYEIKLNIISGTFDPIELDIGGWESELLSTRSFLYFLRFADHYDWKCKEIKLDRSDRFIQVTFYIDQKMGQAKENFNWNATKPGFEFNEIEVDFW